MVFLASPTPVAVPTAIASLYNAAQHTWVAPNGDEWDLSEGMSGVLLLSGAKGMLNPPQTRYSRRSPNRPGSMYAGSVTDERPVVWNLKVFSDGGSEAWIEHNDRLWQSFDDSRDYPGTWRITQPGTESTQTVVRTLKMRFDGLVDDTVDTDLGLMPSFVYGLNFVADEDPFWRGQRVSRRYVAPPATQNFLGGTDGGGYGPPYIVSSGQTTSNAVIPNPGDVPARPTITVNGPTTYVRVGIDGHNVEFPMTLGDGEFRTINTDPADQVCYDENGNDRTIQLGAVDFFEISKGKNVPLSMTITGTGSVEVSLVPGYYRAKGVAQ